MISSIRLDGSTACMALDGTTDTEAFRAYVREVLVPMLQPGDIVVMDCHRAHQNQPLVGTSKPASLRREIHISFRG
jgi:hypothetical protein